MICIAEHIPYSACFSGFVRDLTVSPVLLEFSPSRLIFVRVKMPDPLYGRPYCRPRIRTKIRSNLPNFHQRVSSINMLSKVTVMSSSAFCLGTSTDNGCLVTTPPLSTCSDSGVLHAGTVLELSWNAFHKLSNRAVMAVFHFASADRGRSSTELQSPSRPSFRAITGTTDAD